MPTPNEIKKDCERKADEVLMRIATADTEDFERDRGWIADALYAESLIVQKRVDEIAICTSCGGKFYAPPSYKHISCPYCMKNRLDGNIEAYKKQIDELNRRLDSAQYYDNLVALEYERKKVDELTKENKNWQEADSQAVEELKQHIDELQKQVVAGQEAAEAINYLMNSNAETVKYPSPSDDILMKMLIQAIDKCREAGLLK